MSLQDELATHIIEILAFTALMQQRDDHVLEDMVENVMIAVFPFPIRAALLAA